MFEEANSDQESPEKQQLPIRNDREKIIERRLMWLVTLGPILLVAIYLLLAKFISQ